MKELFIFDKIVIKNIIHKDANFLHIKYNIKAKQCFYRTNMTKQFKRISPDRLGIKI